MKITKIAQSEETIYTETTDEKGVIILTGDNSTDLVAKINGTTIQQDTTLIIVYDQNDTVTISTPSLDTTTKEFNVATRPHGMTYDGTNLWVADFDNDKIYNFDTDGNLIKTLSFSPALLPIDLEYDGTYLYVLRGAAVDPKVVKIDTDGNIISSFSLPFTNIIPTGLTYDGTYLYIAYPGNNLRINYKIDKYTTSGTLISSWYIPVPQHIPDRYKYIYGLTYDGYHIWAAEIQTDNLLCLTKSGELLAYYQLQPHIIGLAWDGDYFWHGSYTVTGGSPGGYKIKRLNELAIIDSDIVEIKKQ